jgi:hypothetical protein
MLRSPQPSPEPGIRTSERAPRHPEPLWIARSLRSLYSQNPPQINRNGCKHADYRAPQKPGRITVKAFGVYAHRSAPVGYDGCSTPCCGRYQGSSSIIVFGLGLMIGANGLSMVCRPILKPAQRIARKMHITTTRPPNTANIVMTMFMASPLK